MNLASAIVSKNISDGRRRIHIPDGCFADCTMLCRSAGKESFVSLQRIYEASVVGIEKMRLFCRREINFRMVGEPRRQGRRAAFRRADNEEIRFYHR